MIFFYYVFEIKSFGIADVDPASNVFLMIHINMFIQSQQTNRTRLNTSDTRGAVYRFFYGSIVAGTKFNSEVV